MLNSVAHQSSSQNKIRRFFIMTKLGLLKEELKELAGLIRYNRNEYKNAQRIGDWPKQNKNSIWRSLAWEYRHKHITYCLIRGRTMKQIENKNREHNEPSTYEINKYMQLYREENVCVSEI